MKHNHFDLFVRHSSVFSTSFHQQQPIPKKNDDGNDVLSTNVSDLDRFSLKHPGSMRVCICVWHHIKCSYYSRWTLVCLENFSNKFFLLTIFDRPYRLGVPSRQVRSSRNLFSSKFIIFNLHICTRMGAWQFNPPANLSCHMDRAHRSDVIGRFIYFSNTAQAYIFDLLKTKFMLWKNRDEDMLISCQWYIFIAMKSDGVFVDFNFLFLIRSSYSFSAIFFFKRIFIHSNIFFSFWLYLIHWLHARQMKHTLTVEDIKHFHFFRSRFK